MKISAVIITFNEEKNIARCLDSFSDLVDDILVVDSYSTDNTVQIAQSKGAKVIQNPFEGHIQQKRYAISRATHPFILSLDADEALSETLRNSIQEVKEQPTHDCFFMNRMSNIGDKWIKHGGWYPDRKMRLFHREKFKVGGINPHDKFMPTKNATSSYLKGDILHYTNSNIESRIKTINHFSTLAAKAYQEKGKKGNWFRLLLKPLGRFLVEYFFRLGFLDGFYGFVIAKTSAQYVFLRESKLIEIQQKKS